jgi:hypothetical protein
MSLVHKVACTADDLEAAYAETLFKVNDLTAFCLERLSIETRTEIRSHGT